MPFEEYTLQDFVENKFFCQWVLSPTEDTSAFWEMFISLHPEKYQDVLKAKALVLAVKEMSIVIPDEAHIERMWQNVIEKTDLSNTDTNVNAVIPIWKVYVRWGWVSAAVILIALMGNWFYYKAVLAKTTLTYQHLIEHQSEKLIEYQNVSSTDQQFTLPDGSSVILTKGSRISYPKTFGSIRTVFLEGDGFFEVKKNSSWPFIVYAGKVITKVVGTSFWVKAGAGKKEIEVDVKTGCVAVALANSIENAFSEVKPKFLLVANQRALYSSLENRLERALVESPLPVVKLNLLNEIVYTDKPVTEIFEAMEKAYAIDLVFDAEVLKNCRINTSFSDETFFQRLEVLCRVLNASYQVVETQIVIRSEGCTEK